jgi:Protein of unknown function (DUF2786)
VVLNTIDKKMDTIRKLLTKAESSTFASEAEAFYAKAQELMREYAIEEELLWAMQPKKRQTPITRPIKAVHKRGQTANNSRFMLFGAIARNSRCRVWFQGTEAYVVGFETDVNFTEMLYLSVSTQMQMDMLREQAKTDINMRTFKSNFIEAYAQRIAERMYQNNNEYVPSSGKAEMVLRDRTKEVDEEYRNQTRYMRMTNISGPSGRYSGTAQNAGKKSADRADLSAGKKDSKTRELNP